MYDELLYEAYGFTLSESDTDERALRRKWQQTGSTDDKLRWLNKLRLSGKLSNAIVNYVSNTSGSRPDIESLGFEQAGYSLRSYPAFPTNPKGELLYHQPFLVNGIVGWQIRLHRKGHYIITSVERRGRDMFVFTNYLGLLKDINTDTLGL